MAVVTGLLALATVALVVDALNVDSPPIRFTALSLTRDDGAVRLSVSCREARSTRFRYVLRDARGVRLYSGSMHLDSGEVRAADLPVAPGTGLVRAQLFKVGRATYRSVDLRL